MELSSIVPPAFWAGFIAFVVAMLALDLFVLGGKRAHKVSAREALAWTSVWVTLSLSVDNIFVFIMIFTFFAVPPEFQRRVLIYGVLGAIIMRAAMIIGGAWLVQQFHWILYLFGAFLVITGIKMLIFAEAQSDLANNPVLKWLRSHLRITHEYHGERFTVMKDGVRWFTPLFLVLMMIETSDVIFAVDSIPAIFAITTDPFIVFTSNIFAIMGLRSLYFLLADMNDRFHLLKYGLALVLVFVGVKMLIVDFYKIPIGLSLGVVGLIIATFMLSSLWVTRNKEKIAA
jgi:TerC family integral membrane protein